MNYTLDELHKLQIASVNEKETEKLNKTYASVAEKIFNKYGPEGATQIMHNLDLLIHDDYYGY